MKSHKGPRRVATNRRTATSGKAQRPLATAPTVEEIRIRAYELYVEHGRIDGQDLEHWLQAEKELSENIRKRHSD